MIYRKLGKTGLKSSLLSLGTGGARKLGQTSGLSFQEQKNLIFKAFDLGVNFIDTAPSYDESERILGKIHKQEIYASSLQNGHLKSKIMY